jgi:hypothetical protein
LGTEEDPIELAEDRISKLDKLVFVDRKIDLSVVFPIGYQLHLGVVSLIDLGHYIFIKFNFTNVKGAIG